MVIDRARLLLRPAVLTTSVAGAGTALTVAWFPRLVEMFSSVDDVFLVQVDDLRTHLTQFVSQGRWGMAAVEVLLAKLGADPVKGFPLFGLAALVLLALAGGQLARLWDLPRRGVAAALPVALASVYPFAADAWSFRLAPFYFAGAQLAVLWAAAQLRRGAGHPAITVVAIAGSLGVYQVGLSPLLVAIALGACLDVARLSEDRDGLRAAARAWLRVVGAVAAACAVYLALSALVLAITGIAPEPRAGLVPLSGLWARLREAVPHLARILWRERGLSTGLLGALQLALLALALALVARRAVAARAAAGALLTLGLLGLGLISVVALAAAARVFWPTPRALMAAGIFWAGVLSLALALAGPRARAIAIALGVLLLVGWLGIDHRAQSEQVRLNQRELARASRIVARLERLPGWPQMRRAVLVGHPGAYADLKTTTYDLNISALRVGWSQAALLEHAAGVPIGLPEPGERELAERRCAGAPRWPAEGAVMIEGALAIVCF